jgi:hypothetical protein
MESDLHTVTLTGGGPWGIRIQGGKDFNSPLAISRVNDGGKGHQAGILVGETIVEINGTTTKDLYHVAAQKLIKNTGFNLTLTLDRKTGKVHAEPTKVPAKVPLVTKSQFTQLVPPVQKSTPKPYTSQPSPPPPPPMVSVTAKAPPVDNFPAPPPPELFAPPPPVSPKSERIKTPNIIDRPSVLAPKQQIAKSTSNFPNITPVIPNQAKSATTTKTINLPPKAPKATNTAQLTPAMDIKQLENELSKVKLANDPAGRKFISPAISPVRPPNVHSTVPEKSGPSGTVLPPTNRTPQPTQPKSTPTQVSNLKTSSESDSKAPTCATCNENIRGKYCQAIGKDWHPECFKCQSPGCQASLQTTGFIEDNGKVFCRSCFERDIAYPCAKCNRKIIGDVMHALNQTWHMTCFVCVKCKKTFQDGIFHWQNEQPYCVDDYNVLFATFCRGCSLRVEAGDQYIEALGASWHDNCFTCATCHADLRNSGFYNRNNLPVCKTHAR